MKKLILVLLATAALSLTGCNKQLIDLNYIKDANSLLAISLEKERRNGLCLIKK